MAKEIKMEMDSISIISSGRKLSIFTRNCFHIYGKLVGEYERSLLGLGRFKGLIVYGSRKRLIETFCKGGSMFNIIKYDEVQGQSFLDKLIASNYISRIFMKVEVKNS